MSKYNENQLGYRKTQIGWIPEDWKDTKLNLLGSFKNGINKDKDDFGFGTPILNLQDVFGNNEISSIPDGLVNASKSEIARYSLKKGDVIFVRSSVKPEGVGLTSVIQEDLPDTVYSGFLIRFRPQKGLFEKAYLRYCFYQYGFRKELLRRSTISANTNVNQVALSSLSIPIPLLPEQQKIAEILCSWDKAIDLVGKQMAAKEKLRKGLMQRLLPGNLIGDIAVDELPDGWQTYQIREVLKRERRPVQVEKDQVYQEIGIRSHSKGIFHKEETTGEKLGNKSVYWVIPDRFILNIVFAWEQAVAKTTSAEKGMIASHRFPMYKPKDDLLDLDYLLYFFQTPYGKHLLSLASPGGAGRNKTLGQNRFMKLSITLLSIDEQRTIGSLIKLCDQELDVLKKRENALRRQKQGLMQKLLTGEVKVKV